MGRVCQQRSSAVAWIFVLVLCAIIPTGLSSVFPRLRKEELFSDGIKGIQGQGPNVIVILADDLGYGDTSVPPFTTPLFANMSLTPELLRMARAGRIMTNFHVASPICSPARASIMTGLFPWRLGIDFIYAQDLKNDGSEELNHEQLPLVPNMAMSFRDSGYHTAHVGKWHLGGMRNSEIAGRYKEYLQQQAHNATSAHACSAPGLLQYGYDEYVCMSEGNADSDRYTSQQVGMTYKQGARYLVRNDIKLPPPKVDRWLTDVQTDEAIRIVREQALAKKPFFLNLWYDAPHSPWDAIEPFYSTIINSKPQLPPRMQKYMSMIANMDWNIGRLLATVDELGIAENTIIVFTSDNGPEFNAGTAGPFQGGKRVLMEGGIRVPAIWQWKGVIPSNTSVGTFGISTDLFPTLIEAAGLRMPPHVRIDGISFLPVLKSNNPQLVSQGNFNSAPAPAPAPASTSASLLLNQQQDVAAPPTATVQPQPRENENVTLANGDERTMLWYTHCPGFPKFTAAWAHGYKLVWNDYEGRQAKKLPAPLRLFNMRTDPTEQIDLLPSLVEHCSAYLNGKKDASTTWDSFKSFLHEYTQKAGGNRGGRTQARAQAQTVESAINILTLANHLHIKAHLFRHIGNEDWLRYHTNKPYTVEKHCARRRAKVDSLTWGTVLPPEFCGDGLSADAGSSNCRCGLSDCSQNWIVPSNDSSTAVNSLRLGWSSGSVVAGLAAFAEQGSSVHTTLANILAWSNFKPLCQKDTSAQAGPKINPKSATTSASAQQSLSLYSSVAYQRVFKRDLKKKRGGGIYVTGSACVSETQVLWQNIHGMHAPLALCPASLSGMNPTGTTPAFDDNAMAFVLNDILFFSSSAARPFQRSIPGAFDADQVKLGNRTYSLNNPATTTRETSVGLEVAVIDPMYAFNLHRASDASTDLGYFIHIMHRLHLGARDVLLVIPHLSEHGWNMLCIFVPAKWGGVSSLTGTPRAENTSPFSIYIQPNEQNSSKTDVSRLIYAAVLQTLRKLRPFESEKWTETAIPLAYLQATVATDGGEGGYARSGMRALLVVNTLRQALERAIPLTQVLSSNSLQKVLDTSSSRVDELTRSLASQYVQRGKEQLKRFEAHIRKATYLHSVGS